MDPHKRRKKRLGTGRGAGAAALLILLAVGGCRFGIPDYTLTVIIEEGVTGTPEAGQYVYRELTTVDYSYQTLYPFHTVEVILNDTIRTIGTSSLIMYGDGYVLKARLVDIRGDWIMKLSYHDTSIPAPGEFTVTLSGPDRLGGTFTDSRGDSGTWTAVYNVVTLTYADWYDYVLTGSVFGMEGTFAGEDLTGSWTATRPE